MLKKKLGLMNPAGKTRGHILPGGASSMTVLYVLGVRVLQQDERRNSFGKPHQAVNGGERYKL